MKDANSPRYTVLKLKVGLDELETRRSLDYLLPLIHSDTTVILTQLTADLHTTISSWAKANDVITAISEPPLSETMNPKAPITAAFGLSVASLVVSLKTFSAKHGSAIPVIGTVRSPTMH